MYIIITNMCVYLHTSLCVGRHTKVVLCWPPDSVAWDQRGPMSNRTGCAGWEREEPATLCKRCWVMRGWLTHKGMKRPMQESALKQNGFRDSAAVFHFSRKNGGAQIWRPCVEQARGLQRSAAEGFLRSVVDCSSDSSCWFWLLMILVLSHCISVSGRVIRS